MSKTFRKGQGYEPSDSWKRAQQRKTERNASRRAQEAMVQQDMVEEQVPVRRRVLHGMPPGFSRDGIENVYQ